MKLRNLKWGCLKAGSAAGYLQILGLLVAISPCVFAQSTSHWIRIDGSTDDGSGADNGKEPKKILTGKSYVNIQFIGSRVNQEDNWLRAKLERNRQVVVSVKLNGTFYDKELTDTRISPDILLRNRKQELVDVGWSKNIAENIPAHFSGMSLTVSVSKSARNGLSDLLQAAATLSSSTPALTISPQNTAYLSAATALSNFIFNGHLLQKKLESTNSIAPGMLCGYYVVFAGDSPKTYTEYLTKSDKLEWKSGQVLFNKEPVAASYFVIRITETDRVFPDYKAAIGSRRPWALGYEKALHKARGFNRIERSESLEVELSRLLSDALTLLGEDLSLTQDERLSLHEEIKTEIETAANTRLKILAAAENKGRLVLTNQQPEK